MGNGIQVDGVRLASKTKGLQWDRAAACERVQKSWCIPVGPRMQEFVSGTNHLSGGFDELRVIRILPPDQMFDELEAAITRSVFDRFAIHLAIWPVPLMFEEIHYLLAEAFWALRVIGIRYQ
jgi:hypothetical protein